MFYGYASSSWQFRVYLYYSNIADVSGLELVAREIQWSLCMMRKHDYINYIIYALAIREFASGTISLIYWFYLSGLLSLSSTYIYKAYPNASLQLRQSPPPGTARTGVYQHSENSFCTIDRAHPTYEIDWDSAVNRAVAAEVSSVGCPLPPIWWDSSSGVDEASVTVRYRFVDRYCGGWA